MIVDERAMKNGKTEPGIDYGLASHRGSLTRVRYVAQTRILSVLAAPLDIGVVCAYGSEIKSCLL